MKHILALFTLFMAIPLFAQINQQNTTPIDANSETLAPQSIPDQPGNGTTTPYIDREYQEEGIQDKMNDEEDEYMDADEMISDEYDELDAEY